LAYGDVISAAGEVAAKITARVPDVKRGSLSVFGDIFGGRVDNIHTVTSATAEGEPDRLVVVFDEGETLEVWEPEGAFVDAHGFRIAIASKVRWEWFYCGRDETPANRYFIEHVRDGDTVRATTDGDWAPIRSEATTEKPAVEVLGMF
jgi:hypothetical protein